MRVLAYSAFAIALTQFSAAFAGTATPPDVDQILTQARTAFLSAKTAEAIAVIEILCRTNLMLISLKERNQLTTRALSLLNDNKFDEANEIFGRVRELEKLGLDFRERACKPPLANKAPPQEAALSPKTVPEAKAEKAPQASPDSAKSAPSTAPARDASIPAPPPEPQREDSAENAMQAPAVGSFNPATPGPAASDALVAAATPAEPQPENTSSAKTAEDAEEAAKATRTPGEADSSNQAASAPAAAESSVVAAAPTAPPHIASSAQSVPTEAEQTPPPLREVEIPTPASSTPTADETAMATAPPRPSLDPASSSQATAQPPKDPQTPSDVETTALARAADGTSIAATTPSSPPEAASSSKTVSDQAEEAPQALSEVDGSKPASSAPGAGDAVTAATPPPGPPPEAIASQKTIAVVEPEKTMPVKDPKLAALPRSPETAAMRPDVPPTGVMPAKSSLTPKRQGRPSSERTDKITSRLPPSEIAKHVARTSPRAIPHVGGATNAPASTLAGAANLGDDERPPLQTVLHRRCPSILASQNEYDDDVVSLCGRWASAK